MTYAIGLSKLGHSVVGLDENQEFVEQLKSGNLTVAEPKLKEMLISQVSQGNLRFSSETKDIAELEAVFIAYDTPIDSNNRSDTEWVINSAFRFLDGIEPDTAIIVCSQLQIGSSKIIREKLISLSKRNNVFVNPENLRLGRASETFFYPDRIIIGSEDGCPSSLVERIFRPLNTSIIWMKNESAEMTKHALNTFLALTVSFACEVAELCENYGADARDVERGLKSDRRIGENAYLAPGLGFSGGTLARDVQNLTSLQKKIGRNESLISKVLPSNDFNNGWVERQIKKNELQRFQRIVFMGVTYVGGTDTLRHSEALRLMNMLLEAGADVQYTEDLDIANRLDSEFTEFDWKNSIDGNVDVLVVMRELELLKNNKPLVGALVSRSKLILDPLGVLARLNPDIRQNPQYKTVGYSVNT
jgi:UDPglucose 6-dehydrogenase